MVVASSTNLDFIYFYALWYCFQCEAYTLLFYVYMHMCMDVFDHCARILHNLQNFRNGSQIACALQMHFKFKMQTQV